MNDGKQSRPEHRPAGVAKEAEALAHEAQEQAQEGHADEAAFLAEEARALDKPAAEAVLKGQNPNRVAGKLP